MRGLVAALALATLPAAPLPAGEVHLLFALGGHPAGVVTLRREGDTYRYRSTHLFALGAGGASRVREDVLRVDGEGRTPSGEVPAGLWLWHRPPAGCVPGVEELDGQRGPLCAEASVGPRVRGTMRGVPFTATYAPGGELQELVLPSARFTRLPAGAPLPRAADTAPLLEGLARGLPAPAGEGPLAWAPPLPPQPVRARGHWSAAEARELAARVDASFPDKGFDAADVDPAREEVRRGGCLAHALRYARWAARTGEQVEVVHGLVRDGAQLMPHAWVRVGLRGGGTLELDVALGGEARPDTHLALGAQLPGEAGGALGERWLSVLGGARRPVVHQAPPAPHSKGMKDRRVPAGTPSASRASSGT